LRDDYQTTCELPKKGAFLFKEANPVADFLI